MHSSAQYRAQVTGHGARLTTGCRSATARAGKGNSTLTRKYAVRTQAIDRILNGAGPGAGLGRAEAVALFVVVELANDPDGARVQVDIGPADHRGEPGLPPLDK